MSALASKVKNFLDWNDFLPLQYQQMRSRPSRPSNSELEPDVSKMRGEIKSLDKARDELNKKLKGREEVISSLRQQGKELREERKALLAERNALRVEVKGKDHKIKKLHDKDSALRREKEGLMCERDALVKARDLQEARNKEFSARLQKRPKAMVVFVGEEQVALDGEYKETVWG